MENIVNENEVVLCRVTKVRKTYFEVMTSLDIKGVIYINEVSDYFVKALENVVKIGDILYLTIIGKKDNFLLLSFKKNRSEFLKRPFEFTIKKTDSDFKNLYMFTNKEIEKWKK